MSTGSPHLAALSQDAQPLPPGFDLHARTAELQQSRDDLTAEQAADVIAQTFGFRDGSTLHAFLDAPEDALTTQFERAVDAIVAGDLDGLSRVLRAHPTLISARSARMHGATLLHYVAANGVENYRQITPPNIEAITTRLLDAGADVNATCDVYGGGATALGLAMTSAHPRAAGVQERLAQRLLERGATIDDHAVRHCLANGCPEAAAFLADVLLRRGRSLALDEAAGLGRIDLVAPLLPAVEPGGEAMGEAMQLATWYDRGDMLRFLLANGVPVDVRAPRGGATPLHVAAYLGNVALVELFLAHGANPIAVDATWNSPPLVWARHAHEVEQRGPLEVYQAVMRLLSRSAS